MGNTRMPTANLERAFVDLIRATGRDLVYVLNKKIVDVGFKAAKNTPKKDPGEIDAELRKDKIGLKIATKQLTKRKGKSFITKKGHTRTIKRVTRRQIATKTKQLFTRRKKRVGFMRAGWIAALVSGGFPVRGLQGRLKDSKSKLGKGQKATTQRMVAMLGNNVWGRLEGKNGSRAKGQMYAALKKAIDAVTLDTEQFAKERLSQTARRFKGRPR